MEQLINVRLSFQGNEFLSCSYLWLDPCAPYSGRKFVFSGIKGNRNIFNHDDTITIDIKVYNKEFGDIFFIQFDLFVLDYDVENLLNDEWWVYGNICNIGDMEYKQGELEVFNTWQKGLVFNWFSLPIHSHLKINYIGACLKHSGLSKKILEKEIYQFDISLIKEELDFFYLASLEFVGDRSYFGHDLHTFKDCLLEMYNHNGYFYNKKISFLNADKIYSPEIGTLFVNVKNVFLEYKFFIK